MNSRRRLPILATGLAVALFATGCGGAGQSSSGSKGERPDSAVGVSKDRIVIGSHQPLTGPAAPGYSKISAAAGAVFKHINDNGGINGRTIEYHVEDDGYNPTKTVEVVKKLVLQDQVFGIVGGLGTPTHSKTVDFLNDQAVPDLFVASGALMWDQPQKYPMTFGFQLDYLREGKIQGKFISERFAGNKVGYLYQNDDIGRDSQAGLDQFLKDQVVARQGYEPGNTNIGPQISALKDAGAEIVVCECIPAYQALAILASQKLDYHPQFVTSSIGSDPVTLGGLLEEFAKKGGANVSGKQMIAGVMATYYLPTVSMTDDPWIQLFKEIHDKYIPEVPFSDTVAYGMANAYTFAQALKAAGDDVTRQGIVEALETSDIKGPGLVPFGYSQTSHAGYTGAYVFQIQADGSAKVVQEPVVTDRGDGPVTPVSSDRPTPEEVDLFTK
jgi:branched-chain amino acid transport system substrate-binding protein